MRKNKAGGIARDRKFSILALDDDKIMTLTLQAYFQSAGYHIDIENDPEQAIERIRNGGYDILLLDFLMSPICGDKVVEEIRKFDKNIHIILLTGHKSMAPPIKTIQELDIQGYYEKSDRFDQLELLVESCVKSIMQIRTIREKNQELSKAYERLHENYRQMTETMRMVVDARDLYTRGHSDRVSYFAVKIARFLQKDEEYMNRVRVAGLFHDIGKVGVPDEILLKEGALTEEEYDMIKLHVEHGIKILSGIDLFDDLLPIVAAHHERIDGKGYPKGISGEDIPEEARIISVADAFDAMTSHRRYRDDLSMEQAMEKLREGRGSQFDEHITDVFLELLQNDTLIQQGLKELEMGSKCRQEEV
jgi:putative nucleotidyltransferase with HDIG domain